VTTTTHVAARRYRAVRRSLLAFAAFLVIALPVAGVAPALSANAATTTDSSVTLSGNGIFSGFHVTVGQTKDLVDQVVPITWTSPLGPDGNPIVQNVQIMECWGDDPAGPKPQNCEYGATNVSGVGQWGATRIVGGLAPQLVDTIETSPSYIAFQPVTGQGGASSNYFDSYTTNEVPYAPTYQDGSGQVLFNMLTSRTAPGLGCGAQVTDTSGKTAMHGCWLVIVPRTNHELTTGEVSKGGFIVNNLTGANSSPLSATNFYGAGIAVPLTFQPLQTSCNINADQRPTFGTELMTGAMSSWESGLCDTTNSVFGFSQVSDDLARNQVASNVSGVGFVGEPIPPTELSKGQKPVYAPVTISGVGIGFYIQRIPSLFAPPDVQAQRALPISDIKLTPRLVAKLLTQSYRVGGSVYNDKLDHSAYDLTTDPEFLALNPEFKQLTYRPGIGDVLMPYIPSDSAKLLWSWVNADPAARAFLNGQGDTDSIAFGGPTFVNPAYKNLSLPISSYPKQDPFCRMIAGYPPLCTLDAHPYANTMLDIANAISRGVTLAHTTFNGLVWTADPPQTAGQINVMGITDTASAARYGVTMASLENSSGQFVAPTTDSMLAAVNAMKTDPSTGTLIPDPTTKATGAYPLTTLSYAVALPSALDAKASAAYSSLLSYAATAGQQQGVKLGQLPYGYVPLPAKLAIQTSQAAQLLAKAPAPTPTASTTPTPQPTQQPTQQPTTSPSGSTGFPTTTPSSPSSFPSTTPSVPSTPSSASSPPTLVSIATPNIGGGSGTYVIAGALILGAIAALGGPVVSWLASRGRI